MNSFGWNYRVTTFGESHGEAVGGIIDGCPSNIDIDYQSINIDLQRRGLSSPREEKDSIHFLSGVKDGKTLGSPIAFVIANENAHSEDYAALKDLYRPSHADYTYQQKYGIRDYRGGGRASARETVVRVVAGAIAKQLLPNIVITSDIIIPLQEKEDDTRGGIVVCRIDGVGVGVGDPIFHKLNSMLAMAMMSIPSAIGFEMGSGFKCAEMYGSEYIDQWSGNKERPTMTNNCGGVQGGISNGMPIEVRVAFHPVVTIPQNIRCLDNDGNIRVWHYEGRHDRCHVGRAAVVVEAMAAITLANFML